MDVGCVHVWVVCVHCGGGEGLEEVNVLEKNLWEAQIDTAAMRPAFLYVLKGDVTPLSLFVTQAIPFAFGI